MNTDPTPLAFCRLRAVSAGYDGQEILCDITCDLPAGRVTGILGASGTGKTTLLRLISGELPAFTGSVEWQQSPVVDGTSPLPIDRPLLDLAAQMGWGEQVPWMRNHRALTPAQLPHTLRQRLELAWCLAQPAPVHLIDHHPGLALPFDDDLPEWVRRRCHQLGQTVVLTTSDPGTALTWCDHLLILRDGQLVTNQPVAGLFTEPTESAYLIQVSGELGRGLQTALPGWSSTVQGGSTWLQGVCSDPAALYGILARLNNLGLRLESVRCLNGDPQERLCQWMGISTALTYSNPCAIV